MIIAWPFISPFCFVCKILHTQIQDRTFTGETLNAIVLKDANAGQDFETRSGDNNKDFIDIKSKE